MGKFRFLSNERPVRTEQQSANNKHRGVTHHNVINANNVIINYGKEEQEERRKYLNSRGGVTDGNQVLSALDDQGYYNTLGAEQDDEVMFIGRKVNSRAK